MLVASSINTKKHDFRNPFLKNLSTFGDGEAKINKNAFEREYAQEFTGKYSPAPSAYVARKSQFEGPGHGSKTQGRLERVCPMVSKHQLSIPNVSPQSYLDGNVNTGFKLDRNNSKMFGTRAARNIDVRMYA